MNTKYLVNLAAALIPLAVGFIWYHPKVLGSVLKKASGVTEEKMKGGKMAVAFLLTYVAGYFVARSLGSIVIHQYGFLGMLANQPDVHQAGTELNTTVQGLLDKFGTNFRSFKHGALHGSLTGLYLILPVFAILTLFERRRWTYFAIHAAYWIICLTLMGGVICAYMPMTYPLIH